MHGPEAAASRAAWLAEASPGAHPLAARADVQLAAGSRAPARRRAAAALALASVALEAEAEAVRPTPTAELRPSSAQAPQQELGPSSARAP